jgi:hypothetical protein
MTMILRLRKFGDSAILAANIVNKRWKVKITVVKGVVFSRFYSSSYYLSSCLSMSIIRTPILLFRQNLFILPSRDLELNHVGESLHSFAQFFLADIS